MKKLNRFQKFVARICKIIPFDIEQALRDAYRKGVDITEKKYAERTMVWIDPTVRQRGYEQSAWNSEPDKHTDPLQVQSIRERAMLHQWQEHPGTLSRLHKEMERKKHATRQLDPDTTMLPVTKQPQKPRFYRLMANPDSPFTGL